MGVNSCSNFSWMGITTADDDRIPQHPLCRGFALDQKDDIESRIRDPVYAASSTRKIGDIERIKFLLTRLCSAHRDKYHNSILTLSPNCNFIYSQTISEKNLLPRKSYIFTLEAVSMLFGSLGFIVARKRYTTNDAPHRLARWAFLDSQLDSLPHGQVLVIGDSRIEQLYLRDVCGKPAFNAGVGGTRLKDWTDKFASMVRRAHSALIVIAL